MITAITVSQINITCKCLLILELSELCKAWLKAIISISKINTLKCLCFFLACFIGKSLKLWKFPPISSISELAHYKHVYIVFTSTAQFTCYRTKAFFCPPFIFTKETKSSAQNKNWFQTKWFLGFHSTLRHILLNYIQLFCTKVELVHSKYLSLRSTTYQYINRSHECVEFINVNYTKAYLGKETKHMHEYW